MKETSFFPRLVLLDSTYQEQNLQISTFYISLALVLIVKSDFNNTI